MRSELLMIVKALDWMGLILFFFMKVWHIVKYDIFDVVSDFFGNDVFFSPINP